MPRYARMLSDGLGSRGHEVRTWAPVSRFRRLGFTSAARKWLGYVDQFVVFPWEVRWRLRKEGRETLFVFADQALGPWVPLVADRPHVIHCHDFLAQRSAEGEFPENPVSRTGKIYQRYIRRGYSRGKNFISVSEKTRHDLHRFLGFEPRMSEVVYNGLNQDFRPPEDRSAARGRLGKFLGIDLQSGFLLHVGGNAWYKNRIGVLEIYEKWRDLKPASPLPLLMLGEPPSEMMIQFQRRSKYQEDICFITNVDDVTVRLAFQAAAVFLFPSLEEGFGWPVAEAMASGCLVVTTDHVPMTEVAGGCAALIRRKNSFAPEWALDSARELELIFSFPEEELQAKVASGIENSRRFDCDLMMKRIEAIYRQFSPSNLDR